jgi:hypothetical protein
MPPNIHAQLHLGMTLDISPTTFLHGAWKPFGLWHRGPHINICEHVYFPQIIYPN